MDLGVLNLGSYDWTIVLTAAGLLLAKLVGTLVAFMVIKGFGKKIISRSFTRVSARDNVSTARAKTLEGLTLNIFSYTLIFIFIVTFFEIIGIDAKALLAGAGVVGLAIGFGAQGLVSDVVTGFFLLLEKQIEVDDYITTGAFTGIVESIGLRTTRIRGLDGTLHFVPNRQILTVSNHSRGTMRALVDLNIPASYDADHTIMVLQEACRKAAEGNHLIKEGPNVLGVQSLSSSEMVIRVIAKTENMAQWEVERDLRKTLKQALESLSKETGQ